MKIKVKDRLKHPRIVVEADGTLTIEVGPKDRSNSKLHNQLVKDNSEWITEQIKIHEKNRPHPTEKTYEFVDGMAIYILGKPYKLKILKGEKTRIEGKRLIVGKSDVRGEIQKFISKENFSFLLERIESFRTKLGVKKPEVKLRSYPKKLGETSKGKVYFNWKILMLEPNLIDYVVLHELVHLKEMNHGKEFWELLKKVMPDYKLRENKLKFELSLIWNF